MEYKFSKSKNNIIYANDNSGAMIKLQFSFGDVILLLGRLLDSFRAITQNGKYVYIPISVLQQFYLLN